MPIKRNSSGVNVHLGLGDVDVFFGLLGQPEPIGAIGFKERAVPGSVDTRVDFPNPILIGADETPARLIFNRVESLDAVIQGLREVRAMMIAGKAEGIVNLNVGITDLVDAAHQNAVAKGWWDEERSFGEIVALIHSEASEALEDFRAGHAPTEVWYEGFKPCGIPTELADVVIRVFDVCGRHGIDLEGAIAEKMAYNATRPIRHGGKKL